MVEDFVQKNIVCRVGSFWVSDRSYGKKINLKINLGTTPYLDMSSLSYYVRAVDCKLTILYIV